MTLRLGSMFSGYGGLDVAVADAFGAEVAWHADSDPAVSRVLAYHWPDVPNLRDVKAIDWSAVEPVDVLAGGYPCQPFSNAGQRKGISDERHLWPWMAEAIRVLRPSIVVLENVRGHLRRGFDTVLADLADLGLDARWGVVRASEAGAPHRRERLFVVAHPADANGEGLALREGFGGDARTQRPTPQRGGAAGAGLALLKTPTAQLAINGGSQHPDRRKAGGHGPTLADVVEHLLPTPAVNDMGAGKTIEAWDEWRDRMRARHGNGNGHGASLAIEVQRFGPYGPAIARWEQVLGREAPEPTQPGRNSPVLAPAFVEWMMGLPEGWVTDPAIGLTRNQQLKALGNGVVPQQAALALHLLLYP